MKICLAVTNDIATDQRVNRIAMSLLKLNAEVKIVGRMKKCSPYYSPAGYSIKRFQLLFNKGPLFYCCYNIRLFLYLFFHRYDIIVSNDLDTLPASFLASKIKKVTLVYDSHEYFTEVPELVGRKTVRKIWESIEGWILPNILYSYTVCESIADIYNKKYGIRMQVIRNLPIKKPYPEINRKLKKGNEHIILYQGSVNIGRGLELVIDAVKYMNNVTLVIAGDGDIKKQLEELVKEKGMEDKVIFTGRIPAEELHSYTIQADIGISLEEKLGLNYYYSLPNKLFDYIQANVPVLVSDFPEMGALVKKYDIGMTTLSTRPEEIAIILKEMLGNRKKINIWKDNLKQVAEELCWEKEEPMLLEYYKDIIKKK